jgi:hypothetical protein
VGEAAKIGFLIFTIAMVPKEPRQKQLCSVLLTFFVMTFKHIYQRKNRLLKVCSVAATSATFIRLFSFFLLWPLTVLVKQTRQVMHAAKQSILLRCLWEQRTLKTIVCIPAFILTYRHLVVKV